MQVKGTRLWYMLVEYVKHNYYARFYDPSYHSYSERHLSVLPNKESNKVCVFVFAFAKIRFSHNAAHIGQGFRIMVHV